MTTQGHFVTVVALTTMLAVSCSKQPATERPDENKLQENAGTTVAHEVVSYGLHVRPILSDKCFFCHGPDEDNNKSTLRLDLPERAYAALKESNGHAIVPGDPDSSAVVQRIYSDDPEKVMPPPESHLTLTAEEKEILRRWITQGAKYETHWAFTAPPEETLIPNPKNTTWAKSPIDSFVLARLEKEGLSPSDTASPQRWLRRVTFDLTGLPPAQAEIDAFLADTTATAKEAVVDRLLASSRFGERMATPWLDVSRYADSFGYQADIDTNAWPYRDWVISALNENLPFDQFIIEQLAGDLLPDATRDQKLATAFNRIHRKTNEGGSVPEEFRQDGISDRIHTVGTAFMGLTFECARCHDHKYDPITAKDYYSLGAFFNSIEEFGLLQGGSSRGEIAPQPALQLPTAEQELKLTEIEKSIQVIGGKIKNHLSQPVDAKAKAIAANFPTSDLAAHFRFDEKSGDKFKDEVDPKKNAKSGGNTIAQGKSGNGILADGDSLTKLPSLGIAHADQSFSFSLWLKPGEAYERAVVFANTSSFDLPFSGYEMLLINGHIIWTLAREAPGCAASVSSEGTIPVGKWSHITVTNDGSRKADGLKVFLNGKPSKTTILSDNLTRDFNIGRSLNFLGRGRDIGLRGGMLDEVSIYHRAISELEVLSIYSGSPVSEQTGTPKQIKEYYHSAVDPVARKLTTELSAARAAYRNEEKEVREIVTMRESEEPVPAYILDRGDYTLPAEKVGRETPSWLPPFPENQPRNRLGFAKWLTSPTHPLTSRVTINRIWQEIFGRGIVATSDNFGLQGELPTHPQLFDWLARDFITHGWDHKRAIRQMVLSATYAQDSTASLELRERDPHNSLLARGPSRRLTAEQIRDSALSLSGLLSETVGGPSVKPYQAPGSMWKTLNNFLPVYKHDTGEGLYRRSLYTFWRRTTTPPNMMIFDAGSRDVCATNRQVTNTPLQPLVMLNDPQFVEAARKLGERIIEHGGGTDASRAKWAYREVIGKQPTTQQLSILTGLISEQREFFKSGSSDAKALLQVGESTTNAALDPTESATAAALAQALLNLDANITLR